MVQIQKLTSESWSQYQSDIMALESQAFSAAQCHPPEFYSNIICSERSLSYIALSNGNVVGFLVSGALELFADYAGVTTDPYFGQKLVIYAADMVVSAECRKQGIGKLLKQRQLLDAKALNYRFVAGRNRLEYAQAMWSVNQSLGAKEIQRLTGIYKDGREPNACIYYHIPL